MNKNTKSSIVCAAILSTVLAAFADKTITGNMTLTEDTDDAPDVMIAPRSLLQMPTAARCMAFSSCSVHPRPSSAMESSAASAIASSSAPPSKQISWTFFLRCPRRPGWRPRHAPTAPP